MKRVTGIGGVFFKAKDPKKLQDWYRKHLGIDSGPYGMSFRWRHHDAPDQEGATAWSIFDHKTEYTEPSKADHMINYRVHDLRALLKVLADEGVEQVGEIMEEDYGRFAWVLDGEGNKVELWEPVDEAYSKMLDAEEADPEEPSAHQGAS